jgi:hypothetical protein
MEKRYGDFEDVLARVRARVETLRLAGELAFEVGKAEKRGTLTVLGTDHPEYGEHFACLLGDILVGLDDLEELHATERTRARSAA